MGGSKKHKRTKKRSRHRSSSRDSSDSGDSRDRYSSSKKKTSRRKSSPSSSDSSRSRSRSPGRSKYKQKRKLKKRSRSRERRRSPSNSRERRKRSSSRSRVNVSRSKDASRSRSRSRERRRSRSASRERRRRRSRSRSKEVYSKSSSRASSLTQLTSKELGRDSPQQAQPSETLKEKMQKALEAAASADAQLRQQGVLTSMTNNERTLKEEIDRQRAINGIESEGFKTEAFHSSRGNQSNSSVVGQPFARDINHDSAIFGNAPLSSLQANSQMLGSGIVYKNSTKLASNWLLSASKEEKEQRWFEKLKMLRKQRLEGNPIQRKKAAVPIT